MIKCDDKSISMSGEIPVLVTQMCIIIHTLYKRLVEWCGNDDEKIKALFRDCLENSFISDEEIKDRMENDIWERMVGDDEW